MQPPTHTETFGTATQNLQKPRKKIHNENGHWNPQNRHANFWNHPEPPWNLRPKAPETESAHNPHRRPRRTFIWAETLKLTLYIHTNACMHTYVK